MKIKVKPAHPEYSIEEVAFPVYSMHDVGDDQTYVVFSRWTADGNDVSITKTDDSYGVEIRRRPLSGGPFGDYELGRLQYECTADEFNNALAEAKAFISKV